MTGGDVAWVRIVLRDAAFANDKAETRSLCPSQRCRLPRAQRRLPGQGVDVHPLRARGRAASRSGPGPSGRPRAEDRAAAAWPLEEIGYRKATANTGDSIDAPVLFRGVQLFHKRPNGLVVLVQGDFNGAASRLWRKRAVIPPIDLAAAITGLGLSLARTIPVKTPGTENKPWIGPPPDAQDAAYVASLLALRPSPNPRIRSNAVAQIVTGWQGKLQYKKPITEADRVILCASL